MNYYIIWERNVRIVYWKESELIKIWKKNKDYEVIFSVGIISFINFVEKEYLYCFGKIDKEMIQSKPFEEKVKLILVRSALLNPYVFKSRGRLFFSFLTQESSIFLLFFL